MNNGQSQVGSSVATSSDISQSADEIQWVEYKEKKVDAGQLSRPEAFKWYLLTRTYRLITPDKAMWQAMGGADLYSSMDELKPILADDRKALRTLAARSSSPGAA